ncbi:MAG: hypothetical protein M3R38_11780 [Actinomycetota bacterium]|nr:hypothetical protein [Actinomycetota bacterium]
MSRIEEERWSVAWFLADIGYGVNITPCVGGKDPMPEFLRPYLVEAWYEKDNVRGGRLVDDGTTRDDYARAIGEELGWGE